MSNYDLQQGILLSLRTPVILFNVILHIDMILVI